MNTASLRTVFVLLVCSIIYFPLPAQINFSLENFPTSTSGKFISSLNRNLENNGNNEINAMVSLSEAQSLNSVDLIFIDPGVTAYAGYRWRDVAGNLYSESYRNTYSYNGPEVQVQLSFYDTASSFSGSLTATNLKPNFTYQMKLAGIPGTDSNERIGFSGRWWQEEWDNANQEWTNGQNLNNKGTGYPPNPNDLNYLSKRDILDPDSPTGKKYRFTGYLPFDFFTTDENGSAIVQVEQNSSFHVFWNTEQRSNDPENDGPVKEVTFDPDPIQAGSAYSIDFGEATMGVFGEWERLPMGGVYSPVGDYSCQFILTEESFHGWPGGSYVGNWASAMGADIQFSIVEDNSLPVQLSFFRAEFTDNLILIEWSTESELNNAGFEIYKSTDTDSQYSLVSSYKNNPELIGQGNSNHRHEYSITDEFIEWGRTYFYRLAEVDFSGVKTFYGPISVTLAVNLTEFILKPNYPNPFNSTTTIKFQIPYPGRVTLKIYDSLGKESETLLSGRISAGIYQYSWNTAGLGSGIYYIFLKYGNTIRTQKAVLVK
jgi:hypothetical protein